MRTFKDEKQLHILVVQADGAVIDTEIPNTAEALEKAVGGVKQNVYIGFGITIVYRDEMSSIGLPYNKKATEICKEYSNFHIRLRGTVIFAAGTDRLKSLDDAEIKMLLKSTEVR